MITAAIGTLGYTLFVLGLLALLVIVILPYRWTSFEFRCNVRAASFSLIELGSLLSALYAGINAWWGSMITLLLLGPMIFWFYGAVCGLPGFMPKWLLPK